MLGGAYSVGVLHAPTPTPLIFLVERKSQCYFRGSSSGMSETSPYTAEQGLQGPLTVVYVISEIEQSVDVSILSETS
jgi:hypothetical protein